MTRLAIILGASNAALAIILGAFAAHALEKSLSERMLSVFKTAVEYHLYHALGLIILGLLFLHCNESNLIRVAIYTMLAGIVLFSGSLYILSLTGTSWLGMITPLGGMAFIVAWILVVIAYLKT